METSSSTIQSDEQRLVELLCDRIVRFVRGATSIGLGACVSGMPEPREFVRERIDVVSSCVQVLGTARIDFSKAEAARLSREFKLHIAILGENIERLRLGFDAVCANLGGDQVKIRDAANAIAGAYGRIEESISRILTMVGKTIVNQSGDGERMVEQFLREMGISWP